MLTSNSLSCKHTERQRQRPMLVYSDAWEWGGSIFLRHHKLALAAAADADTDARYGYILTAHTGISRIRFKICYKNKINRVMSIQKLKL